MTTLPLPNALIEDIQAGLRPLPSEVKQRLGAILQAIETPMPELYDLDAINGANRLWESQHVGLYLGTENEEHPPGSIDPRLACIIGHAEPDSPIALDYRVSPPRVLYLGSFGVESFWIELASSYEHLVAAISPSTPDSYLPPTMVEPQT